MAATVSGPDIIAAPELYSDPRAPRDKVARERRHCPEIAAASDSLGARDGKRARAYLETARQRRPELPPVALMLGRLHLLRGDAAAARTCIEEAAAAERDYPGIFVTLGEMAIQEARLVEAALLFERALELAERDTGPVERRRGFLAIARAGLASVAEQRRDWKAAAEQLVQWTKLDSDNSQARQRLGRAYFELGDHDRALLELRGAAAHDPSLATGEVALAWLFTRAGNTTAANEWMDRAIRARPDDAEVRRQFGRWLLEHGRVEEAQREGELAAQLAPHSSRILILQGLIAQREKRFEEAEEKFERVRNQAPGDFEASDRLAQVLIEQPDDSKRRRATQIAEVNARQFPDSTQALATLGRVYFRLGRTADAERAFSAALEKGPVDSDTLYLVARFLDQQGKPDRVPGLLKRALDAPGLFLASEEAAGWLAERVAQAR